MKYTKCNKVGHRIECLTHDYPYCEALFPDSTPPLDCNLSNKELEDYIAQYIVQIVKDTKNRYQTFDDAMKGVLG